MRAVGRRQGVGAAVARVEVGVDVTGLEGDEIREGAARGREASISPLLGPRVAGGRQAEAWLSTDELSHIAAMLPERGAEVKLVSSKMPFWIGW